MNFAESRSQALPGNLLATASLHEKQVSGLVQAAAGPAERAKVVASKATLLNAQRALLVDFVRRPFVVGITDSEAGRQPKIAVIDDGMKLNLRMIESRDGAGIQLEGRVELREVTDVGTASAELNGKTTTIQVPRVKRWRIDVNSALQDRQTLLVACFPTHDEKWFTYVLLTVRKVSTAAE